MSRVSTVVGGCLLVAVGFVLGRVDFSAPEANAQDVFGNENSKLGDFDISNETVDKIRLANDALTAAQESLRLEAKYKPATVGVNAFLILTGGGDVVGDLEQGQGIDPESFAALYAGQGTEEVKDHLSYDSEGRLTYKNQLVRMKSPHKLKSVYEYREELMTARLAP